MQTKVYSSANLQDAYIVRDILRQESIPVDLRGENLGIAMGELPAQDIAPTLWVPSEMAERARKIVADLEASRREQSNLPEWTCSHCGEQNEGQFAQCWSCCREQ